MANKPLKPKEVTDLLSKLKSTTPDYPADLMAARRAAFVKKAIAVKLEGKGPGGKGGQHGGSGGRDYVLVDCQEPKVLSAHPS